MNLERNLTRRRAVEVHDETAAWFASQYGTEDIFESPFRYGRHLIDRAWAYCVSELQAGAKCLDVGCGIGTYMARLLEQDYQVSGIEPSQEMRRIAEKQVPASLISDGSVLELPASDSSLDFAYAIEVLDIWIRKTTNAGTGRLFEFCVPAASTSALMLTAGRWTASGRFRRFADWLHG